MTDHITLPRAVVKQALETLEELHGGCTDSDDGTVEAITVWCPDIIAALRAALANPGMRQRPISAVTEAVTKVVIQVETLLCEKLNKRWQPEGMSIQTLVDELAALAEPVQEPLRELLISAAAFAVATERKGQYKGASWVADEVLAYEREHGDLPALDEPVQESVQEPVAVKDSLAIPRDDIIRMMREAGMPSIEITTDKTVVYPAPEAVERFAVIIEQHLIVNGYRRRA